MTDELQAELVDGVLAGWRLCLECHRPVEPWSAIENHPNFEVFNIHLKCLQTSDRWPKWKRDLDILRKFRGLAPFFDLS